MLASANLHVAIIDTVLEGLKLATGVNRSVLTMVGILSHDDNDFTELGHGLGRGIDEGKSVELVIVNASDIYFAKMSEENKDGMEITKDKN